MLELKDIGNIKGRRALLRVDLNVPVYNGVITNDARIRAIIPTIEKLLSQQCDIILMSHFGRPQEGEFDADHSLRPVAEHTAELLQRPIQFVSQYLDGFIQEQSIACLENVRFNIGERANDTLLGKKLAALADIVVMDAFAAAHRAHASTHAVIEQAQVACAGLLLCEEIQALRRILLAPQSPVVAIIGGAKVSTKLPILESLANKVDHLIVGGGIANTFIAAAGHAVGQSLCEHKSVDIAKRIMSRVDVLPLIDVVVADEFSVNAKSRNKAVDAVLAHELILDAGQQTVAQYAKCIHQASTVLLNGPLGVAELDQFACGTIAILDAVSESDCYSVAGGGDMIAAIDKFDRRADINYISTGGGAFLAFLEGKKLPALAALEKKLPVK